MDHQHNDQTNIDRKPEVPTFQSAEVAKLYQDGRISRVEADSMDAIYAASGSQGDISTPDQVATAQPPTIAYISQGHTSTIFTLDDLPEGPTSVLQRMGIAMKAGRATINFIVSLLERQDH